jgi:hypothetical protein
MSDLKHCPKHEINFDERYGCYGCNTENEHDTVIENTAHPVKPLKKPYTVVMEFADGCNLPCDFTRKVMATSVKQAIFFAKYEVKKEHDNIESDHLTPLAVYAGHMENLL